ELIVSAIVASVAKLGKHIEAYYDLMAGMDKIGHILDLPMERDDGEGMEPVDAPAALGFREVDIRHHGHGVFHGLNFSIGSGERVAVMGACGSGKTTLLELAAGLLEPNEGYVEIDGSDLRSLDLADYRSETALVGDAEILEDTILENVRAGRGWVSLVDVQAALAAVGLLETARAQEKGLSTMLNHRGAPLSCGQAQRLTVARALVGHPRLLLIDQSLDRLDAATRSHVLDSLLDRRAPWTLLLATQDLETAARCDRTLTLGGGGSPNGHAPHGHGVLPAPGHGTDLRSTHG
ncbi:MAG: ATP-binding cassette domain-containing protein, partial [Planctomycetia bacterium]